MQRQAILLLNLHATQGGRREINISGNNEIIQILQLVLPFPGQEAGYFSTTSRLITYA